MSNEYDGAESLQEDGLVQKSSDSSTETSHLKRKKARAASEKKSMKRSVTKSQESKKALSGRTARRQIEKAIKASQRSEAAAEQKVRTKLSPFGKIGRIVVSGIAVFSITGFAIGILLPTLGASADRSAVETELVPNIASQPLEAQSLEISGYDMDATPSLKRDSYSAEAPPRPVYQQVFQRWTYHLGTYKNNPNGKIQWPFPSAPVSSPYGPRWGGMHTGTDFSMPRGTPISAVAEGKVAAVGWNVVGLCGYGVLIDHGTINGQKISSLYCHMSDGTSPLRVGQEVSPGQTVGKVGSTGAATGPHLHLEIWVNGNPFGKGGTWADPYQWLRGNAG